MTEKLTELEEIERITASNEFWTLGSGDHLNMIETLLEKLTEKDEAIQEEWLNAKDWEDEYMILKRRFDELDKSALETYELLKDSSGQAASLRKALEEAKKEAEQGEWGSLERADEAIRNIINLCAAVLGEGDKE